MVEPIEYLNEKGSCCCRAFIPTLWRLLIRTRLRLEDARRSLTCRLSFTFRANSAATSLHGLRQNPGKVNKQVTVTRDINESENEIMIQLAQLRLIERLMKVRVSEARLAKGPRSFSGDPSRRWRCENTREGVRQSHR